jgi:cytoskeletal protein RodZ
MERTMKRDTLKTLAGLVVIAVIVVATFLYGNAQRQAQLRRDQDLKKQQAANQTPPSNSATPTASGSPAASSSPANNTAPVKSPAASSLQGTGGTAQQPAPSGQVAGVQTTPQAGGTGAAAPASGLPETGAPVAGLVGVTAIGVMMLAVRRSKRGIFLAARGRR